MNTLVHRQLPPTPRDAEIARSTYEALSPYGGMGRPLQLRVSDSGQEQPMDLPAGVVDLLTHVLEAMAGGQGIALVAEGAEITTVQAARALNVSRPFLIKLLDQKAIPHRKVGKDPWIRVEDVMAHKNVIGRERKQALAKLTREAQAHDMGYGTR